MSVLVERPVRVTVNPLFVVARHLKDCHLGRDAEQFFKEAIGGVWPEGLPGISGSPRGLENSDSGGRTRRTAGGNSRSVLARNLLGDGAGRAQDHAREKGRDSGYKKTDTSHRD